MNDGIDGIGEAVTGSMAARAVERGHGEGRYGHTEIYCSNCSTKLVGTHCHYCGQKAHVHRSIAAIGHDLIHGVLHLDGKFWRTLPLLMFRPGELTWRYIHGERAKFVSPLGMFLFGVFLMFGILTVYGVSLSNIDVGDVSTEMAQEELENQIAIAREERSRLDRQLAVLESQPGRAADADALRTRIENIDGRLEEFDIGQEGLDAIIGEEIGPVDGNSSGTNDLRNLQTGWDRLDYGIQKIQENPGLALYKLQANFYKFSWLLIPISVPFVWLLFFYTRRFKMYDHTVFVTYSLAFMSLFAILLTVLGFAGLGGSWIVIAALSIPFVHMYKQLRGTYDIGRITAFLRTCILAFFCFFTALIFFILLLAIGALG
ncbi:DUF3667 domain-containing protein [Parasphingopyxis sp.]|uniref:DUF3667 domain-containing protein n=1 Tax=Parasphingopyxis sp. TaxID=1920299 RepID=UPI00261BCDD7|nr:DUF3667 domain-containing protein [Parasphingopyxis sp.]